MLEWTHTGFHRQPIGQMNSVTAVLILTLVPAGCAADQGDLVETLTTRPCADHSPHIDYSVALKVLHAGSHRLRVVHAGADGRTRAGAVLDRPIIVTENVVATGTEP